MWITAGMIPGKIQLLRLFPILPIQPGSVLELLSETALYAKKLLRPLILRIRKNACGSRGAARGVSDCWMDSRGNLQRTPADLLQRLFPASKLSLVFFFFDASSALPPWNSRWN